MIYGYARVSTRAQERDGNSLECQREQLVGRGATEIYVDTYTGKTKSRPELDRLVDTLKSGDTLVVTKLDRMARSVRDGLDIVDSLVERGVMIDVMNMGRFDNTPMGHLMRTILFAFAEYEHAMILERTSEGRQRKRDTDPDYREGRPKLDISDNLITDYANKVNAREITVVRAVSELGISRSTWYSLMREKAG